MSDLIRYDAARSALQAATSVDEVKDIRDKAQAMAAYARQAKDTQLVEWATEIKVRAERRAGEMLAVMPMHNGGRPTRNMSNDATGLQTLPDLGISRDQSSRWQKLAAVPEVQFERAVAAAKEVAGEVTTAAMLRLDRPHVANNSGENEWYTPAPYVEAARLTMGRIDCDPASSEIANKCIRATTFYSEKQNGLLERWRGAVWMNPPYAQPLVTQFSEAVVLKFESKEIEQACVLVNNATETAWFQVMLRAASAVCFPRGRVRFIDRDGNPSGAPLQGQAVLYIGPNVTAFASAFASFGAMLIHPQK